MTRSRAYGFTLVLLLVGAVALLLAASQPWVNAETAGSGLPTVDLTITGGQALPLLTGAGLLLLAGIAGVVATGGIVRVIVGVVVLVTSAIALESAVSFGRRGSAAAEEAARAILQASGTGTNWWWLAAIGAVAGVLAGTLTVALGKAWPTLGSRYQRRDARTASKPSTPSQMWDAMDRGEDPTIGPEVSQ